MGGNMPNFVLWLLVVKLTIVKRLNQEYIVICDRPSAS